MRVEFIVSEALSIVDRACYFSGRLVRSERALYLYFIGDFKRGVSGTGRLRADLIMGLEKLLAQKKSAILTQWFAMVAETYPADTAHFLQSRKDSFANPVGSTIRKGLNSVYDELLKGLDHDALAVVLDPIVRIRAVQDFTPSQATSFIFFLKQAIRNHLEAELGDLRLSAELLRFESRIDDLSLIAFNIYMQCREKIYELKANEIKKRTFSALKRANLLTENPEDDPEF